jgi:glycosyltransferase involved in cell wall biosynthesis
MPKFSIITPTILRVTANRTMESVDAQTSNDYEHIVIVDGVDANIPNAWLRNPRRYPARCRDRHNDCGATCRNDAVTKHARGDYILYLDDDDYYVPDTIETLARLVKDENFGVFPIMLSGERWLRLPPGPCRTPTCGMYHRRMVRGEIIAMPRDQRHYADDSAWAGQLAERFGYRDHDCPPLAIVERGHNSSGLPGGPPRIDLPPLDMEVQSVEPIRKR